MSIPSSSPIMNPEDKRNIQLFQSFSDRIETVKISYVLDLNTEVEIYRNIFGKNMDETLSAPGAAQFCPGHHSTRLNTRSDALLEWIGDPQKYDLYCDENLQLLKMEIYTGYIPPWLDGGRSQAADGKDAAARSSTNRSRKGTAVFPAATPSGSSTISTPPMCARTS